MRKLMIDIVILLFILILINVTNSALTEIDIFIVCYLVFYYY